MTTVMFKEFNLKYYLRLHPEMLPAILYLDLVGWLSDLLSDLKRKLSRNI